MRVEAVRVANSALFSSSFDATRTHPWSGQRSSADGVSEGDSMHDGKERVKESVRGREDGRERFAGVCGISAEP